MAAKRDATDAAPSVGSQSATATTSSLTVPRKEGAKPGQCRKETPLTPPAAARWA
jgi:hypothetical protein